METYQKNPDGSITVIGPLTTVTMADLDKQIADLTRGQQLYTSERDKFTKNITDLQAQIDALNLRKTNIVKQFPEVADIAPAEPSQPI